MELFLACLLLLSAISVLLARKPVWAGLSFLVSLLTLSLFYFQLSAHFIAAMQILVYAGAIMVIFMFVIVLFQDAYQEIDEVDAQSSKLWTLFSLSLFLIVASFFLSRLVGHLPKPESAPAPFGTVASLGKLLFVDFFFPFEALIMLFLVSIVGAVYIARER